MSGVRRGVRERRYRRALLFYPRSWRQRNADVVLATLLDVADAEGRRSPRASEMLGLATSGLSTRLSLYVAQSVRDAVSTIALATGAVMSIAFAVLQGLPRPSPLSWGMVRGFGPFLSPGIVIYALWILAFGLALCRATRVLRIVLVICLVAPAALWITRRLIEGLWSGPTLQTLVMFTVLALLVLAGTPRPAWYVGVGMAAGLGSLALLFRMVGALSHSYADEQTFWQRIATPYNLTTALLVAVFIALVLGVARRGAWAQTLLISLAPIVASWCVSILLGFRWDGVPILAALAVVAAAFSFVMLACRRSAVRDPAV